MGAHEQMVRRYAEAANAILDLLGGRRFETAAGAKHIGAWHVGGHPAMTCQISTRNRCRARHLRVVLEPEGTYRMEFLKGGYWPLHKDAPYPLEVVATREHVACNQLQQVFEDITGFTLHMSWQWR